MRLWPSPSQRINWRQTLRQCLQWCGLAALLAVAHGAHAQTGAQAGAPSAEQQADWLRKADAATPRGPLFAFSKDGKTHYLFGSLHVGKPEFLPPDWGVNAPLAYASAIALEVDPSNMGRIQAAIANTAMVKQPGAGLAKLPTALANQLRKAALAQGMGIEQIERVKPWFLANLLGLVAFNRAGFSAEYGSEAFIAGVARGRGVQITDLEGIEMQMQLFDSMPPDVLADYVQDVLRDLNTGNLPRDATRLLAAWESGDLAKLDAVVKDGFKPGKKAEAWFNKHILIERNASMAQMIDQLAAKERCLFVAVGALHLPGDQGLVALLRKAGYVVEPAPRGLAAKPQPRSKSAPETPNPPQKGPAMPSSSELKIEDIVVGNGNTAATGNRVSVHYTGWLYNDGAKGAKFDSSVDRREPFVFELGAGRVIQGWDQGVAGMKVGGKRLLTIPPAMGYGARGAGGVIPPNATLLFEVELLDVK